MGTVIRFPLEERIGHDGRHFGPRVESATVIILPVIRIDRHFDEPAGGFAPGTGNTPGRGRRRRATRS
jgi:hypothetical protein